MSYSKDSIEHRLIHNDTEALARVSRWIAEVMTTARFWRLRPEWADLHQEILLRVVESLRGERFDASRDFKAYVQVVARYTALNAVAARARRAGGNVHAVRSDAGDEPAEKTLVARQLVKRVLDLATPECRSLIQNYFLEGLNYAEIAAVRDMREGTVKSRLFRCLKRAHRALQVTRRGSP